MNVKINTLIMSVILFGRKLLCDNDLKVKKIPYSSKADVVAERLSNFMFNTGKKYFGTKADIHVILPTERDNTLMLHTMNSIVQTLASLWVVTSKDTYCCDRVRIWKLSYRKSYSVCHVPDVYIIPVYLQTGVGHLELQLDKMIQSETFNPKAIFILLQLTTHCGKLEQGGYIAEFFNKMWAMNVFSATLLVLSDCDLELTVVTAKPFSPANTCRTVEKGGLKYFQQDPSTREVNITLIENQINNFYGCVFIAGTVPNPPYVIGKRVMKNNENQMTYVDGYDIKLLHLLSIRMNFTYEYSKTISYEMEAWFKQLPNFTIIGILQDVLDYKTDIAFGALQASYVVYSRVDYSKSYKYSSLTWFVADANVIPQWMIFFVTFDREFWILSGFTFVTVSVLYYLMNWYSSVSNELSVKPNLTCNFKDLPLTNLFSLCLGQSTTLKPKTWYLRVLFFSWAVYFLHWSLAYTSVLFTQITNPPIEKEITTIEDLKDSGLRTSIAPLYIEILANTEVDELTKSVTKNHFVCNYPKQCVEELIQNRNFSVLERVENIEYLVNLKRSKIHKLSDRLWTAVMVFVTSKGSPLLMGLNKLLQLTLHSGLLQKWEKDVHECYYNIKNQSEEDFVSLSLQDLKGAFFILITGLVFALIMFICESIMAYVKRISLVKEITTV